MTTKTINCTTDIVKITKSMQQAAEHLAANGLRELASTIIAGINLIDNANDVDFYIGMDEDETDVIEYEDPYA